MGFAPTLSLVTGASSGIGVALARALAEHGSDLVLVARREDRLTALASELRRKFGIDAEVVALDVGAVGAAETLKERTTDPRPIDTVINCAGMATHRPFILGDGSRAQGEIQVNIGAVVDITPAFLPTTIREGRGATNSANNSAPYGCSEAWQNPRKLPDLPANRKALDVAFFPSHTIALRRASARGGLSNGRPAGQPGERLGQRDRVEGGGAGVVRCPGDGVKAGGYTGGTAPV